MKAKPMYCEYCPGQGEMCEDCFRDYLKRVSAVDESDQDRPDWKRRRDERIFWLVWSAAAAVAVAFLVYSLWPKK